MCLRDTTPRHNMRECWNWQTGMTKDHVSVRRAGSSPAFRIKRDVEKRLFFLEF